MLLFWPILGIGCFLLIGLGGPATACSDAAHKHKSQAESQASAAKPAPPIIQQKLPSLGTTVTQAAVVQVALPAPPDAKSK